MTDTRQGEVAAVAPADGQAPLRIVISGYFGFDNLGDEAILQAVSEHLRLEAPGAVVTALSGNPIRTRSAGVEAVHRLDLWGIVSELKRADLFISGGGSLLQDVTGLGSVPYYLGLMALARALGVPAMMLGQGVGPLDRAWSRLAVGRVVSRLQAITVRDDASAGLLEACGVPREAIEVTADPVLALRPAEAAAIEPTWRRLGMHRDRPVVAVSLRPWRTWTEQGLKSLSAVLSQCAVAWDAQVLLLPFHRPDDEWLLEDLRQCLAARPEGHRPALFVLDEPLSPARMLALMQRVDLLIGMRLHALIMAAAVATPALAVVYDPKVVAFAEQAGYGTIPSVEAMHDATYLAATLDRAWQDRDRARRELSARADTWQARARRNGQAAVGLARRHDVRGA